MSVRPLTQTVRVRPNLLYADRGGYFVIQHDTEDLSQVWARNLFQLVCVSSALALRCIPKVQLLPM